MSAQPDTLAGTPLAQAALSYWCGAVATAAALEAGETVRAALFLATFGDAAMTAPRPVQLRAAARFLTLNGALNRALSDEVA